MWTWLPGAATFRIIRCECQNENNRAEENGNIYVLDTSDVSEMDEENIQGMVLGDSIANDTGINGALNVGPVMILERGIDNEVMLAD